MKNKVSKTEQCPYCEVAYIPLSANQSECWNCANGFFMNEGGDILISEAVVDQTTTIFLIGQGVYQYMAQRLDPANYSLN